MSATESKSAMTEKVWAYFVYQLVVDSGILELNDNYVPEPSVNSILLSHELHGKGNHTVTFEDGPVKTYADLVYLGEGGVDEHGNITFDLGTKRLLNLISIGLDNERVLTAQIHDFAERVQTKLEPMLTLAAHGAAGDDFAGNILREVDEIEKHFWDRKR